MPIRGFRRGLTILAGFALLLLCRAGGYGQSINLGISTLHDQNIFDSYTATPDQITQLRGEASKDWDYDQAWLGIAYGGAFQLYQSIPQRNYHVHTLSGSAIYHLENHDADDDAEEEESGDPADSTQSDSTGPAPAVPPQKAQAAVHSDSLDHFITASLTAGMQFDKADYAQYDHSAAAGTVSFRQPLGIHASIRPYYAGAYNAYPNLASITNIQNKFGLLLGIVPFGNCWLAIGAQYGHKMYTSSNTFSYTFHDTSNAGNGYGHPVGHGKGNSGGGADTSGGRKPRTVTYSFTSPSVSQSSVTIIWEQRVSAATRVHVEATRIGNPSSQARVIPERVLSAIESRGGSAEEMFSQDLFDDHFAYSGNEAGIRIEQELPYRLSFSLEGHLAGKTFTTPATTLAGDTLAANRVDTRSEVILGVSRPFPVFGSRSIAPQIEFHYLRNSSNEPFYDFDKNVLLAGVELTF